MPPSQIADLEAAIDPDQVSHIEISRSAARETAVVRVSMIGGKEAHVLEFANMVDAIAFYQRLWSLRTSDDDRDPASNIA